MGGQHAQRVALMVLILVGLDIAVHGGTVLVHIALFLEAADGGSDKLDLAGRGLQALAAALVVGTGTPVGSVLHAVLGEPAQSHSLGTVGVDRHHKVPLLQEVVEGHVLGHVGGVIVLLNPGQLVLALVVDGADAQAVSQLTVDVEVGLGLAHGLDALVLEGDDAVVTLDVVIGDVAGAVGELGDVPALEVGAGGEDQVGEGNLALEPDGLRDHALQAGIVVHLDVAVALLHGADVGAAVVPVHVAALIAGSGVLVLVHLVGNVAAAEALAVPGELLALGEGETLGDTQAGHMLAGGGVDVQRRGEGGPAVEHAPGELEAGGGVLAVAGDAALGVAGEEEGGVHRGALGGGPHVGAGLAHALHGAQGDHAAGPLNAVAGAAGSAPAAQTAGGQIGVLLGPLAGQGADLAGGYAGLGLSPLAGLGLAVGLAQHVVGPLLEAVGVGSHVLLVVGALGQPGIGDGEGQGMVGAHLGGEPLVGEQSGRVVVVGVNVDHLDAQVLLHPLTPDGGLVSGVDTAVGLRVGGPHDDHLGVLQAVLQQVILLGVAQTPGEAPHVHAAPVPALPGVGVVVGVREAHQVHEAEVGGVTVAEVTPHVVGRGGRQDGGGAVLGADTVDLLHQDVVHLVPGNALVAGNAAVLGIALPIGIPVHALHGVQVAPVRVDHGLEAAGILCHSGLAGRSKLLPPGLDGPGRSVHAVVKVHGGHADDLPIFDVDENRSAGAGVGQPIGVAHFDANTQLIAGHGALGLHF